MARKNRMRSDRFKPAPQSGGTVLGLIIGLIIGLSIAVWVAVTIMKTPLPFVDKLVKQTQPAGELGDPNKTMSGGARERREKVDESDPEASAPLAPAAPAAPAAWSRPPATPAPSIESVISSKASVVERPKSTVTTSQSANVAVQPPVVAPDAANEEKFTYYLQAGAFRELSDAENARAKLALMGVVSTVAERRSELGVLYRVRVGPFVEVEALNRVRTRMSDNGVDAAVVRVPK